MIEMEMGLLDYVEQRGVELGIQKGKIEGKLEGKLEGQRELLRTQLEARFGALPSFAVARLQAWPSDRLADFACALLSAASLDELGLGPSASAES